MFKRISVSDLVSYKQQNKKWLMLTSYDSLTSSLFDELEIPVVLVGDSSAQLVFGHDSTVPVTMEEMLPIVGGVTRANKHSLIVADMPFGSYQTSTEVALENATKFLKAGAHAVKLEGGQRIANTISVLVEAGIPVMGHIGLTPQSVNVFGGYKVQGRDQEKADRMVKDALALQEAGAQIVLLECVPAELAERITQVLDVPVIGIGAGNVTDGQILVMHDMFGISANYMPKFSKNFLAETGDMRKAVAKYIEDVANGVFPDDAHTIA